MNLDLTAMPFSRCGSYIAFSRLRASPQRPERLFLRTVHGGAPLRDRAYTWTSSVFLILAHEYLRE
jgi:hypothetical protein